MDITDITIIKTLNVAIKMPITLFVLQIFLYFFKSSFRILRNGVSDYLNTITIKGYQWIFVFNNSSLCFKDGYFLILYFQ